MTQLISRWSLEVRHYIVRLIEFNRIGLVMIIRCFLRLVTFKGLRQRKYLSNCNVIVTKESRKYYATTKVTPIVLPSDSETTRPVFDIDIPVPWGVISGKWWGDRNTRPILCIHGWQDNAGSFDELINFLPRHMSYLCIDLPGHGLSSNLPEGVCYHLWWDGLVWIREIAQYFGWNKVSILAHSLGTHIGYMYAGSFPDDVDLLIMLDPIFDILFSCKVEKTADEISETIDNFLRLENAGNNKETAGTYEEMIEILSKGHKGALSQKACEILSKRGMYECEKNLFKFCKDARIKPAFLGGPSFSLIEEMSKRIKCRCLSIVCVPGSKNLDSYKYIFESIRQKAPYCEIYPLEENHHVHLTHPEKVAPKIIECLSFG